MTNYRLIQRAHDILRTTRLGEQQFVAASLDIDAFCWHSEDVTRGTIDYNPQHYDACARAMNSARLVLPEAEYIELAMFVSDCLLEIDLYLEQQEGAHV